LVKHIRFKKMRPIFYMTKSICLVSFLFLALNSVAQKKFSLETLFSKKWYISTNFTSLFRHEDLLYFEDSQMQTTNRFITLEPEVAIKDNLTIRFPLGFGINYIKGGYSTYSKYNSYYYYLLNAPFYNTTVQPYFSPGYTQQPYTVQKGEITPKKSLHRQDLIFQLGINPKLYFFGQRKASIYFSPSLTIGIMDSYALDYYHSFLNDSNDPSYNHWIWKQENILFYHNPFIFSRFQACLGFEFNFSRKISWGFETGFTTFVFGEGKKDDHVFISLDGGEFKQIYTDQNPDQMTKTIPFHFTNRILLRVAIN